MKNIFILIISLSYVLAFKFKDKLLHCITDEVAGGSYKYYSLTHNGFIKIILSTEIGDADLYVSQIITRPTYELDEHCFKSITCGEDIVLIPNSFKRPVNVGVYGHPWHKNSKYILLIYETRGPEDFRYEEDSEIYNSEEQRPIPMTIGLYLLDLIFQILF